MYEPNEKRLEETIQGVDFELMEDSQALSYTESLLQACRNYIQTAGLLNHNSYIAKKIINYYSSNAGHRLAKNRTMQEAASVFIMVVLHALLKQTHSHLFIQHLESTSNLQFEMGLKKFKLPLIQAYLANLKNKHEDLYLDTNALIPFVVKYYPESIHGLLPDPGDLIEISSFEKAINFLALYSIEKKDWVYLVSLGKHIFGHRKTFDMCEIVKRESWIIDNSEQWLISLFIKLMSENALNFYDFCNIWEIIPQKNNIVTIKQLYNQLCTFNPDTPAIITNWICLVLEYVSIKEKTHCEIYPFLLNNLDSLLDIEISKKQLGILNDIGYYISCNKKIHYILYYAYYFNNNDIYEKWIKKLDLTNESDSRELECLMQTVSCDKKFNKKIFECTFMEFSTAKSPHINNMIKHYIFYTIMGKLFDENLNDDAKNTVIKTLIEYPGLKIINIGDTYTISFPYWHNKTINVPFNMKPLFDEIKPSIKGKESRNAFFVQTGKSSQFFSKESEESLDDEDNLLGNS